MLKVAGLPHTVVLAFANPDEIQVKPVDPLAVFCSDEGDLPLVFKRAHILCDVQAARQRAGKPPMGAADVIRQLLNGPDQAASSLGPSPVSAKAAIRSVLAGFTQKAVAGHISDTTLDTLRRERPSWDYQTLHAEFKSWIGSDPKRTPVNYQAAFIGFVRRHHSENKHTLPRT
jgi:hypothetical protein